MISWNRLLLLALPLFGGVLAQDDIVRFNFRFGFFDDNQTPLTEVIKEDVEGVLCQTQYFLSHLVQNATDSKSVHAKATQIDWGYYEGDELPAHINFTVEFTDAAIQDADVNWIDDRILITEMEALGQPGLQKFITEWVWKSEPEGLNFFLNANKMAFDGLKQEPVQGQLSEAACPETVAPTAAPTISPSPTLAPTVTPPNTISNANGTSVPPEGPVVPPGAAAGDPGLGPNATGVPPPGAGAGPNGAALPGGGNPSGAIPPPVAGTGVAPNNARKDWPFGPNYATTNDLDTMADFSLQFAMFEEHETPPTLAHVNALMCEINAYFTEALRRKLLDGTIHSKGVYIDYYFDEGGVGDKEKEDIVVNFTAFVYYGDDEHNQVPVNDVFEAMKLTPVELKDMVEHYVWLSEPYQFNTFFHTERVGMNAAVRTTPLGDPKDVMLLEADGCILPPNPDGTPSSAIPSNPSNGIPAGGPTTETPPSSNIADYDFPDVGGNAQQTEIVTNFRVSNLENIQDPVALKAFGLDASFPVFTYEMVRELGNTNEAVRRLLRKADKEGRQLNVVPKSGSPQVDSIQQIECPPRALPGLTCHDAVGRYEVLMSSDENVGDVQTRYTAASERAVNDGTYNNVLQRVDPDTPLFIGIMSDTSEIPPGSLKRGYTGEDPDEDDDGWFKWWYLLLLLLLLLCCCLICLYCWMLGRREEPTTTTTKEVMVEERDLLVEEVEEFDDEDQPSAKDRGLAGPGDEEFVDDPDAGVMVPYANDDPNDAPPPNPPVVETGVLVPYDPDSQKAHDDQLERDRILNNASQRGDEGEYLNEASQRDNSTRDISQRDYGEEEQEDHGDETVPLTKVESDEQGVEVDDVDVDELQESRRSKKDDQEWEEDDR